MCVYLGRKHPTRKALFSYSLNASTTNHHPRKQQQRQEYLTNAYAGKISTAYHDIWGPDYPAVEDYLTPIYATSSQGARNYGEYSNGEFDDLLAKASAASSTDEANKLYVQAEEILLEDLPSIPLYNTNATSATVKNLKGVAFNWDSSPTFWAISKS